MRAVVVYESVFGNTHHIAEAVGEGLAETHEVEVLPVDDVDAALAGDADLLVVGGPTHMHGMARASSKAQGAEQELEAADEGRPAHELDDQAFGETLRHWFHALPGGASGPAAAFDTRIDAPGAVTGHASKGIARRLRHHGFDLVHEPESFLVTKDNDLIDGELDRAREWGHHVGRAARS